MIPPDFEAQSERCPTGMPGFDEVTEGDFVRGSIVLLAGNPGTGKSTFAAKFIHDGALKWMNLEYT